MFPIQLGQAEQTGHPLIDQQHQMLVERINEAALHARTGGEIPPELLRTILSEAEEHFRTEEEVMSELTYPGLEEQASEHRKLLAQLEAMVSGEAPGVEVVVFLANWVGHHTRTVDGKLRDHFQS